LPPLFAKHNTLPYGAQLMRFTLVFLIIAAVRSNKTASGPSCDRIKIERSWANKREIQYG